MQLAEPKTSLGAFIREKRLALGLTQKEAARKTGIKPAHLGGEDFEKIY